MTLGQYSTVQYEVIGAKKNQIVLKWVKISATGNAFLTRLSQAVAFGIWEAKFYLFA